MTVRGVIGRLAGSVLLAAAGAAAYVPLWALLLAPWPRAVADFHVPFTATAALFAALAVALAMRGTRGGLPPLAGSAFGGGAAALPCLSFPTQAASAFAAGAAVSAALLTLLTWRERRLAPS